MKRTLFIGCLIALLSACGTNLSETELSTAGFSDVPIVTDNEQIAEGLGAAGFETILAEPDNLLEVHQEVQGGLVSYTPLPPEINPWWPWPFPWPWWNPFDPCDPRYCDPVDPLIGWQFEGAYLTPKLAEMLMSRDLEPQEVSTVSQEELGNLFEEVFVNTNIEITTVTCGPDGCKGTVIAVSPTCFASSSCMAYHAWRAHKEIENYLLTEHLYNTDIVITNSANLANIEAKLGALTQLQGDGTAPVVRGINVAAHPNIGEEVGMALAESLLSEEVQISLYEHAGVLPVNANLLNEIMNEHIEGALNHGTLTEDPQPGFFGKEGARPTPVPFSARPTPIPVN